MVGITWTEKDLDLSFMDGRKAEYWIIHNRGTARKNNPEKDAFLEKTYKEYVDTFPGRVEAFNLPKLGTGGTPAERKERTLKRFRDWFSNHLDNNSGNGKGSENNILKLTDTKGTRRITPYNAYYDSDRVRLEREIKSDYDSYKEDCKKKGETAIASVARRNHFLSESLKKQSPKVQEDIKAKCLASTGNKEHGTITELFMTDNEEDRLVAAKKLQTNINKLIRTMEKASEAIQRQTGWSVVILTGGPEPQRAGSIRTLGITKGSIPDTGKHFEEFCPNWSSFFDHFTEFCENVTPPKEREMFTMQRQPSRQSSVQASQSPSVSPDDTSPSSASAITVSQPGTANEITNTSGHDMDLTSPTSSSQLEDPSAMPMEPTAVTTTVTKGAQAPNPNTVNAVKAAVSATAAEDPDSGNSVATEASNSEPNSGSSVASTATAVDPTTVDPTAVDISSSIPAQPLPQLAPNEDSQHPPTPPAPSSVGRTPAPVSKRSFRAPAKNKDDETKIWTYDAGKYLEGPLQNFGGAELVRAFVEYEKNLGNPVNKTKPFKLDLTSAPLALKQWHSGSKDFSSVPSKLGQEHLQSTVDWYLSLQPPTRGSSWPLARSLPTSADEWVPLFKGGPNGFFLILMALSWAPTSDPNQSTKITELASDATWVLQALTAADKSYANITASTANAKKRKAATAAGRATKKARTSA